MGAKCFPNENSFKIKNYLVLLGFFLLLTGCGGAGQEDFGKALGGGFSQGEVRPLEFDPNGKATLTFGDLSGNEEFALILFAANVNQGSFRFDVNTASGDETPKFLEAPTTYLDTTEEEEDPTSRFHEMLRKQEEVLAQTFSGEGSEKALSLEDSGAEVPVFSSSKISCAEGEGIQINVLNSLNSTDSYDVTCGIEYRSTTNVDYYVDQEIAGQIPSDVLNRIIDGFESKIPLERSILGHESDVDDNGKFCVYFTPGVNRLGSNAGGFVTGYFFGGDLYPKSSFPGSNEMECLFILVPDPTGKWGTPLDTGFWASNLAPTVPPHEYQHMISFNYKVLLNKVGAEDSWANEGLSHLMEDLDPQTDLQSVSVENPSRVALYLDSPNNAAFTAGTSLAQRGGAYLFFRYLCEQADLNRFPGVADCHSLLGDLLHSKEKGVSNVEAVTGWTFRNLLLDFFAALQLSDTGITSNPRYNFQGIHFFGSQQDNRGTVLNGVSSQTLPAIPVSGSVSSPGGLFYSASGSTLMQAGNSVTLVAQPGMIPGAAVIRLQ